MQVDWAGGTIPYYDSVTGEEYKAYLFVAVLPCSGIIYVEACTDMKQENWLLCHVHAYEYLGGVTKILVPYNLKTGVTANTRYEIQLNASYRELAEYYGTAIVPARVRKPQDKGLVEKSVGFSTTWITAALREQKFLSFSDVKTAVAERLEVINNKPFQKRPGSRREAYENEEKEFMLSLPAHPYEPAIWTQATDGSRVTSHKRLEKYSVQPVVNPDHMPENHRKYLRYNVEEFRRWSADVGKCTESVVKHFLETGKAPEQGYKSCVSLVKPGEKYSKKELESACERMIPLSSAPSIRTITTILKNSRQPSENTDEKSDAEDSCNKYGITRGAAYFRKGGADNE